MESETPVTGDNTPVMLLCTLMLLSAAGLTVLFLTAGKSVINFRKEK